MSIQVRRPAVVSIAVFASLLLGCSTVAAQTVEGLFVTVPNPITSDAVERIQKQIETRLHGETRRVQTVVFDFNPDGKPAATAKPGVCSDLAAYIRGLQSKAVLTVAFVHGKVSGHTVMPVLACQELVMSSEASIGEIAGEGIEAERGEYRGYFGKDEGRFALIRKMYDRDVALVKGRNRKTQVEEYADDREDSARDPKDQLIGKQPVPGVQKDRLGLYTAAVARSVNLARAVAESRKEVAELYGLSPSVIRDDPLGGRTPDVYRWVLDKDVDGAMRESVMRVVRDVRKKGGNVLILVINCGGHDLVTARGLADDLRNAQAGEDGLQIIGFIPDSAPAAGTVVALGCTDIVMTRPKDDAPDAKNAVIGDFETYLKSSKPGEIEANLASIRELAEAQGYSGVLIDGMFKRELEIVRANKLSSANRKSLMTRERFNQENEEAKMAARPGENPDLWIQDKVIKNPGQLLKLPAPLAAEVGIARFTVEGTDVKDVCALYGYKDAKDPDPGWLDKFAEFLRIPVVTVLLVVIGFTGLILELKVPGLTVPGIIAALCFILVFWSQSRFSGQTFVLALLLFLLGIALVGIELFVLPGFGASGIFGILCMLAGLGLVTLERVPETAAEWGMLGAKVSQYMFAMMGAIGLAFTIARFLPRVPYANRLILAGPSDKLESVAEALPGGAEAAELLGAIGTTSTPLRPAGVVKFGEKFVDVVSDGGFIAAGTRVKVIQVEGTRIVVNEV